MKYPLFKFIVLTVFVLLTAVLIRPTNVSAYSCAPDQVGLYSCWSSTRLDYCATEGQAPRITICPLGTTCTTAPDGSSGFCQSAPTASLTATPNPVVYGGRSTLAWISTSATSCTAGGPWSNSGTLNGSGLTDPLYANTTFTFQCTGQGGTTPLQSVTVSVGVPPVATAALSASPNPIAYGGRSTLIWSSSNADSCTAYGPWSNSGTLNGSGLTDPLYADTTFQFQCSGPGGTSAPQSVTVMVIAPISGVCGSANGVTYTYGATNYTPYSQCSTGFPSSTAFPTAGSSISWTCSGTNGGASSGSCSARQSAFVPSFVCGNGICEAGENILTCPIDCKGKIRQF